jgi:hypothetical protein
MQNILQWSFAAVAAKRGQACNRRCSTLQPADLPPRFPCLPVMLPYEQALLLPPVLLLAARV